MGLGVRLWGLGLGLGVEGLGLIWFVGSRVQGLGLRVYLVYGF